MGKWFKLLYANSVLTQPMLMYHKAFEAVFFLIVITLTKAFDKKSQWNKYCVQTAGSEHCICLSSVFFHFAHVEVDLVCEL